MGIVKGSYVKCNKTGKVGVVDSRGATYIYVEWLIGWKYKEGIIHPSHFTEYVEVGNLTEFSIGGDNIGLKALRNKLIR